MINYRAEELPQQARMLTILALYHSYTGDDALLLKHFPKARTMAEWIAARREASLQYGAADPRYGIPPGVDEGACRTNAGNTPPIPRRSAAHSVLGALALGFGCVTARSPLRTMSNGGRRTISEPYLNHVERRAPISL